MASRASNYTSGMRQSMSEDNFPACEARPRRGMPSALTAWAQIRNKTQLCVRAFRDLHVLRGYTRRVMNRFLAAVFIALIGAALAAQSRPTSTVSGDWPMYSYNLAGTRYSPLTDINTNNVSTLTQAWSVRLLGLQS